MREKGGGEGMSLFFSSRFSSFPFLSLTFSFSLSRAHTRWYVPSARERPSSLRDHKDNTQHCPLPSKYDVFFYDQSTKSVLCRIPKEKKANDRRRSGTKTVKGHRSTFFFYLKGKKTMPFFFFTDLVTVNDPTPPFFKIQSKLSAPGFSTKYDLMTLIFYFIFWIWLEQIWLVGTHFSFFKRKLTISVESRPIPRELATCVRGKYLIISSGISRLVEKTKRFFANGHPGKSRHVCSPP